MSEFLVEGPYIGLRRLTRADKSLEYLVWLNDPVVQEYTRRRGRKVAKADLERFLENAENSKQDQHLAIILKESNKHIGNLSLLQEMYDDPQSRNAELTIMVGDKNEWGKGYAQEAISIATKFVFENLGLHKLWADSPVPAFNVVMKKLGWTLEGTRREAFFVNGKFVDVLSWGILENEWQNGNDINKLR